jgi:hypothetical protein
MISSSKIESAIAKIEQLKEQSRLSEPKEKQEVSLFILD